MRRVAMLDTDQAPLRGSFSQLACVDEVVPADEGFAERPLAQSTIQITIAGGAEVSVNGNRFTHRPGRLFAAARGALLAERSTSAWRLRYLMLDGPWCEPLVQALTAGGGGVMLDRPPRPWVDSLEMAVTNGLEGGPGSTWRLASSLATLIGGLIGSPPGDGDLLAAAGRLVDAAPERSWGVPALARSLRIPPRRLQRRFRDLTGSGPARWVLERRMAHARLLLQRGMLVREAAERMGFANPFHFSRAFTRCCGVAPSAVATPD